MSHAMSITAHMMAGTAAAGPRRAMARVAAMPVFLCEENSTSGTRRDLSTFLCRMVAVPEQSDAEYPYESGDEQHRQQPPVVEEDVPVRSGDGHEQDETALRLSSPRGPGGRCPACAAAGYDQRQKQQYGYVGDQHHDVHRFPQEQEGQQGREG